MRMLDQLPAEIIHCIASHLPSASSIINLSLTTRKIHIQLSADDYATFRSFVQRKFPTIRTPPYWKDTARVLTTRSRAWDRRAFIASALESPARSSDAAYYDRSRGTSTGYRPVIDSYEGWQGRRWVDKHEVLVWGAAGRLIMRVKKPNSTRWFTHKARNDHLPQNDILDIHVLRPEQRSGRMSEEVLVRRANNEITKVGLDLDHHGFQQQTVFDTIGRTSECMTVSYGPKPLVAAINTDRIHFFDATTCEQLAKPNSTFVVQESPPHRYRQHCARFLGDERLAVAVQYVEGHTNGPIKVYRLTPDGSSSSPEKYLPTNLGHQGQSRTNANAIVPLDDVASLRGRAGDVFLSGWSDGIARLYDTRAPAHCSVDFKDDVDDGQVLSLLSIGHEKFIAGSGQNACLKIFDLRMPGAKVYHSSAARSSWPIGAAGNYGKLPDREIQSRQHQSVDEAVNRQLNILLAIRVPFHPRLWQSLPRQHVTHLPRYRGAIYSLSAPSPTSPTVYAGVENHVIQLDSLSTDDVLGDRQKLSRPSFRLDNASKDQILNLSCYERPRPGYESTDAVLLRNQVNWGQSRWADDLMVDGWDERWTLASLDHRSRPWCNKHLLSRNR